MTNTKLTTYRGIQMIAGWPEKIEEAQTITHLEIDGKVYPRIPYGQESFDWNSKRPCRDCSIVEGEFHVPLCLKEQCPKCGEQLHGCDCKKRVFQLH